MKTFKYPLSSKISTSFFAFLLIFTLLSPWLEDIHKMLSSNILNTVLLFIGIYGVIFLVTIFVYSRFHYEMENNEIRYYVNGLITSSVKYSKFDTKQIIIEEKENLWFKLFGETRFKIFNGSGLLLLNIPINKEIADEIISELLNLGKEEKLHFSKNRDFFYNNRNTFSLFIRQLIYFVIYTSLSLSFIFFFKLTGNTLFSGRINLLTFVLILCILLYVLITLFSIVHNTNTSIKIDDKVVRFSRGRLLRNTGNIPRSVLTSYTIKIPFIFKKANVRELMYTPSSRKAINIPLHKENISYLFDGIKIDYFKKNSLYILEVLIRVLVPITISVLLWIFGGLLSGLFFFASTIPFIPPVFINGFYSYKQSFVIKNGIVFEYLHVISYKDISKVRIRKFPLGYSLVTFITTSRTYNTFVKNSEVNDIKIKLGYYKKS